MRQERTIPDGARCIVYTRVSKPSQATEEKASLDAQLAACRRLAAELGHADPAIVEDKGRSAFKEKGRLESLVAWCEAHPGPGLMIAYTHSRFARVGGARSIYWVEKLKDARWALRFVDSPFTGNVSMDDWNNFARFSMSHAESAEKQTRSRVGGRGAANLGKWNGGPPPIGYAIGADKHLTPGKPSDIKKVRAAFKAYAKGATLDAIGQTMGKGPSGVRVMLANPAYVGTIEYGKGPEVHGREDAHPAIIGRDLWDAVQDRLKAPNPRYSHDTRRSKGALPYVLSKVVRCSCGEDQFLVGGGGVRTTATAEQRMQWSTYRCKACLGRVGQAALEAAVYGAIAKAIREADERGDLKKRMEKWVAARVAAGSSAGIERERADLLKRKARLIKLAEETDDRDVSARIREVNARLRELDIAARAQPNPRGVKAEGARILAETRAAVAQRTVTPEAANLA